MTTRAEGRATANAERLAAKDDPQHAEALMADGWKKSSGDGLWRTERFGGAYKIENALLRLGSEHGELTRLNEED